eukprot:m.63511 g.63511  ORF g.63511 m.63511 type:complete len:210 (+) comp8073_c1_seq2:57-686(+)
MSETEEEEEVVGNNLNLNENENDTDGTVLAGGMRLVPSTDEPAINAMKKRRDIGDIGAWTLSSCKAGCGIDKLRNTDAGTYWQSEGEQPHIVTVEFMKKTEISAISVYVDFEQDESYTPQQITIKIGNHGHDMRDVKVIQAGEATGFLVIPLGATEKDSIKTFVVRLEVNSNHQNGRDTHIRMMRIHPPEKTTLPRHMDELEYYSPSIR